MSDRKSQLTIKSRSGPGYLSIVLPFYNEANNVKKLIKEICLVCDDNCDSYEIVCIDDGSRDDTLKELLEARELCNSVKVIQLSRNFGQDAAITAGIEHVSGDVLVIMDSDLQHPPSLIPDMLDQWRAGYDVVCMLRENRHSESVFTRFLKNIYYKLLGKISNHKMVPNTGNFRLMDKSAYQALMKLPEKSRYLYGLYQWIGFPTTYVKYTADRRHAGESKWHIFSLLNKAISGIVSFSTIPLRFWSVFGASIAFLSFLYGLYIIVKTVVFGVQLPGFATITTLILFFGGLQLFSIGVIGEYLASLFMEAKNRPVYLIYERYGFDEDPGS